MQPPMMQMSLLDEPPLDGAAPVWATLDGQQRTEVVDALARVIVRVAESQNARSARDVEETTDE